MELKHSLGNLTGLTIKEFLILPARARLSITYVGDYGGEGFISIKRLQ